MIPVNEPALGARELEYVTECVTTGWISSAGRFVDEFERAWADYCGRRHGASVCNGTAALQVAVEALDLGPGDEVIMPTFTIISCALAVVRDGSDAGARRLRPGNLDDGRRAAAERGSRREPGRSCRCTSTAIPSTWSRSSRWRPSTGWRSSRTPPRRTERSATSAASGVAPARSASSPRFSFFANKLVTTGEGGMVVTDDDALAERLRALRNLCVPAGAALLPRGSSASTTA